MKGRIDYIDQAKGIGILLVLIGHCSLPLVGKFIYMFHMPLFYILSGILWKNKLISPKEVGMCVGGGKMLIFSDFIKRKCCSLLLPYLKISIVCLLIYGVILKAVEIGINEEYFEGIIHYIIGLFVLSRGSVEWMPMCSPIWFLTALFFAENIFFWIMQTKRPLLFVIVCGIVGGVFAGNVKIPLNIDNALVAIPYLYMGYKTKNHMQKFAHWPIIIVGALSSLCIFAFGYELNDFDGNTFDCLLATYIQSTIIVYTLLSFLIKFKINFRVLSWFGKNTLPLLGYNYLLNIIVFSTPLFTIWLRPFYIILLGSLLVLLINYYPKLKRLVV